MTKDTIITLEITKEQLDFIIEKFDADLDQGKNWLVSAIRRNDDEFKNRAMKHIDQNENLRRIIMRQVPRSVFVN